MIAQLIVITISGVGLGILQTTLFAQIIPFGFVPDIALLMIVACAWRYGSTVGEIAGFLIGLCFDVLGLAPLGFHAFLYTLIGYLFGRMQDSIAPGTVLLPALGGLIATVIKYGSSYLLALVFGLNSGAMRNFSLGTLWEGFANIVLAPLVFAVVALVGRIAGGRRGGFR